MGTLESLGGKAGGGEGGGVQICTGDLMAITTEHSDQSF
jgi:hypothetical protein